MNAYQEDLAYIHDVGHGDFARQSAPGILEIFRKHGITNGMVLDLGCGSGIWAEILIQEGYEVRGYDISEAMIQLARKKAPKAEFTVGSFLKADLPECVAVTSLGECLSYLFDSDNTYAGLRKLFQGVFHALVPGGLFLFDIPVSGRHSESEQKHRVGKDWAVLVTFEENKKARKLTRHIKSFCKVGDLYRRSEEVHVNFLHQPNTLAETLRKIGFRVRPIKGYGNFKFPKGLAGILARKPKT